MNPPDNERDKQETRALRLTRLLSLAEETKRKKEIICQREKSERSSRDLSRTAREVWLNSSDNKRKTNAPWLRGRKFPVEKAEFSFTRASHSVFFGQNAFVLFIVRLTQLSVFLRMTHSSGCWYFCNELMTSRTKAYEETRALHLT